MIEGRVHRTARAALFAACVLMLLAASCRKRESAPPTSHPKLRQYANKAIAEQRREIALMDIWRDRWWKSVPRPPYHGDQAPSRSSGATGRRISRSIRRRTGITKWALPQRELLRAGAAGSLLSLNWKSNLRRPKMVR